MPYLQEHAARQHQPGEYKSFARKALPGIKGIDAIYGVRKSDGKTEIQSFRFDKKVWSPSKARAWLKQHGKRANVEAAKSTKASVPSDLSPVATEQSLSTKQTVADDVREQLSDDYPPESTQWVESVQWDGPKSVSLVDIDFANEQKWRASAEPEKILKFAKKIQKGKLKPMVLAKVPGNEKLVVLDGHHRALANRALGRPGLAYVATVPSNKGPWMEMHSSQTHGPSTFSIETTDAILLSIAKAPTDLSDNVLSQLSKDYPPEATAWVKQATWSGPRTISMSSVDLSQEQQWRAASEPKKVEKIAKKIQKGKLKPIIAVQSPDSDKYTVVDGHHHALAYLDLGRDPVAYVGQVPSKHGPWTDMHSKQIEDPSPMSLQPEQQTLFDVGVGAVHVPGTVKAKPQKLYVSAKQRDKMPASQFGDPANKSYPIHDKAHADNAAARLEQQKGSMSPGKYAAIKRRIKAAQRRFGEKPGTKSSIVSPSGYRISLRHPGGGSTVIQHRMSALSGEQALTAMWLPDPGQLLTYIPIDKTEALAEPQADESGNKRIWVQIARTGAWAGHPQGAFAITPSTLDQMVQNFYAQDFGRIQWDFDHASAMPANSGTLPQIGKPAQGWIYALRREGDRLFALTEWLPLAKQYIKNDQYTGVSPVINWHFADRATGKEVGPTITSVALTNLPFITGMDRPIAASLHGIARNQRGPMPVPLTEIDAGAQLLDTGEPYCYYSDADLMSQLKQVFGLHELATAQQCKAALSNLTDHLDAVDGDGSAHHEGVDLGTYIAKMRDLISGAKGMSATEVLQFLDGILDAYMKENGIADPDEDLSLSAAAPQIDAPAAAVEPSTVATAASTEGAIVADPQTPPVVATDPATVTPAGTATPPVTPATETAASVASTETPTLEQSELILRVAALEAENTQLKTQMQSLSASAETEEQRLSAEVDSVIRVYGQSKGLKPELKPHLLQLLKAKPDAFRAAYPPVAPDQEHLLLNLTGGGASNPNAPGARVPADTALDINPPTRLNEHQAILALGLNGLTDQLVEAGIPFSIAQIKADQKIREARQALEATRQG